MPEKRNPYSSYGQKLISLFAALLFSRQRHSLIELSRMLRCSKQTVLRLVDDIKMSYGVDIEETIENRKKYYRLKRRIGVDPTLNLTESEISVLQMCRAFTEHLLGRKLFEEAARALLKSQSYLPENKRVDSRHFASFVPGSIDYTGQHQIIRRLINAMDEKKICILTYKRIAVDKAKIFYIKPLKIFSHKDTVYLHARMARYPGKPFKEPDFDPLLAVHRIQQLELTERSYEFPENYDFEKVFNKSFGVVKEKTFKVEIEFKGYSAEWVKERIWSSDQKITRKSGNKIIMAFSVSSELEFVEWLLSFEDEARLIHPDWLIENVKGTIDRMRQIYA